jgi:subtilase family serine protease
VSGYFTSGPGAGLTAPAIRPVNVNGPGDSPGQDQANDAEVLVDICTAAEIAQQATINVYFTTGDEPGWLLAIKEIVQPTMGESKPSVVSISWGAPEVATSAGIEWSTDAIMAVRGALAEAAAAGITFLAAAGDQGASCGVTSDNHVHVNYPASDPSVTGCGGTMIGTLNGMSGEFTWYSPDWNANDATAGWQATGGGVSHVIPIPAFQQGFQFNIPAEIGSQRSVNSYRGVPDICGYAAPGFAIYQDGETQPAQPGTSGTAPLYAGLIAVICQALGSPVGDLNSALYVLAADPSTQAQVFHQIADGNTNTVPANAFANANSITGYTATAGSVWNACNGLGVLDGSALLTALVGQTCVPQLLGALNNNEIFVTLMRSAREQVNTTASGRALIAQWEQLQEDIAPTLLRSRTLTAIATDLFIRIGHMLSNEDEVVLREDVEKGSDLVIRLAREFRPGTRENLESLLPLLRTMPGRTAREILDGLTRFDTGVMGD